MDSLELVITNIKKQRGALKDELDEAQMELEEDDPVTNRSELRRIIGRNKGAIEALEYALAFLENLKEE